MPLAHFPRWQYQNYLRFWIQWVGFTYILAQIMAIHYFLNTLIVKDLPTCQQMDSLCFRALYDPASYALTWVSWSSPVKFSQTVCTFWVSPYNPWMYLWKCDWIGQNWTFRGMDSVDWLNGLWRPGSECLHNLFPQNFISLIFLLKWVERK